MKTKRETLMVSVAIRARYSTLSERAHVIETIKDGIGIDLCGSGPEGFYSAKSIGRAKVQPLPANERALRSIARRAGEYLAVRDKLNSVAPERLGVRWRGLMRDEGAALGRLRKALKLAARKRAQSRQNKPGSTNKTPTNAAHQPDTSTRRRGVSARLPQCGE